MSIVCEVEPDPREGARSAGSTGEICAPRRSSKRCKRFDFQKSASYCRFLKVRLRKHPHGMFSPLRMTRGKFSVFCSFPANFALRFLRPFLLYGEAIRKSPLRMEAQWFYILKPPAEGCRPTMKSQEEKARIIQKKQSRFFEEKK